jgi:ZIP Zinc transporter
MFGFDVHHDHHHQDHSHDHGRDIPHSHQDENIHVKLVQKVLKITKAEQAMEIFNQAIKPLPDWGQALASTLFISVVPIFFIYALNVMFLSRPSLRDKVIYYLISFAVGGLLGDVFFHTLPHLSEGSGHSHDHHHHDHAHGGHGHSHDPASMGTNMIIISGIISFFLLEKIVANYLSTGDSHNHSHGGHTHHGHDQKKEEPKKKTLK